MHFSIGADHRGFSAKAQLIDWLNQQQISYQDFGATAYDPEDDYNDYAKLVVKALLDQPSPVHFGILLCGSAQGMAMQANRYHGIRASVCYNPATSAESRSHNHANVLCIPVDDQPNIPEIIQAFLQATPLTDPKYLRRNQKLDEA